MPKTFLLFFVLLITIPISLQNDYDSTMAFEMLRASSASYCDGSQLLNMTCGDVCNDLQGYNFLLQFTSVINFGESVSYSMFVNPVTKRFVTSFRGSSTTLQLLDEVVNGGSTPYTLYNIPNAIATKYFFSHYNNNIRQSFLTNFQEAVQNCSDYEFYFVGHSLGGAFATHAILDIVLGGYLDKNQVHIYNYGSPRVGNYAFVQAVIESIGGEIFRVVHYQDIVAHVPPCFVNLKGECETGKSAEDDLFYYPWHVGPEIFYSNEDSTEYKICTKQEDSSCSDKFSFFSLSVSDHLHYLGVPTGCGGNNVFPIIGNNFDMTMSSSWIGGSGSKLSERIQDFKDLSSSF